MLNSVGNQDICHFNYRCAIPYNDYIKDVNHIISNIGYLILGVFFVIIVWYKDHLYTKARAHLKPEDIQIGIPQHFGIFYALGYALITVGILSMCYHVCPTNENFQFDTTFMYVVAILLTLKLYQFRHPDVTPDANKIFFSISLVLLFEAVGIHYSIRKHKHPKTYVAYWVILSITYVYGMLKLGPILYKSGKWGHPLRDWNLEFIVSICFIYTILYNINLTKTCKIYITVIPNEVV